MGLNARSTTTINIYAPWNVDINAMCEHIHHAQPLGKKEHIYENWKIKLRQICTLINRERGRASFTVLTPPTTQDLDP